MRHRSASLATLLSRPLTGPHCMVQCSDPQRAVFGLHRRKMAQSMYPFCIQRCKDFWFARVGFRSHGYIPGSREQNTSVATEPPAKTRISGSSVQARRIRGAWRKTYVGMVGAALILLALERV